MTAGDIWGLVLSYVYAFSLLLVVEFIGKKLNWSQFFTRKIIHIGAGLWTWALIALFDTWYFGLIPFATFILLNYIFYRKQTFEQMDGTDSTPGTVYFAFSITLLMALFWRSDSAPNQLPIALAGIMAMTLGDGFAAILGRGLGKHFFHVFGNEKSVVGSAAMFIFGGFGIWLVLAFVPVSSLAPFSLPIAPAEATTYAFIGAAVATAVEAISPRGLDNLSVPLLTSATLWFLM